jgi:phytanoyl-CoA hydroxylase
MTEALTDAAAQRAAASPAITLEQKYFFEANGYLVVPDALSVDELSMIRVAADEAEGRWRADPTLAGVRRPDLDQIIGIMEYAPVFVEMLQHRTIFPLVRELLGPDIMMLDNDYFITPPGALIHRGWHYDEGFPGVYPPRSRLMIKVFFVLQDIPPDGGGTMMLPGSHRFPSGRPVNTDVPEDMPAGVRMALPARAAYLMAGRTYHCVGNNLSDRIRRLLIYTYGHKWMRIWDGYTPSPRLAAQATTPMLKQLLGLTDPYGPNAPLSPPAA